MFNLQDKKKEQMPYNKYLYRKKNNDNLYNFEYDRMFILIFVLNYQSISFFD